MKASFLAFELVGLCLLGLALGSLADHLWGLSGVFQGAGLVLAFILWLLLLFKYLKIFNKENQK